MTVSTSREPGLGISCDDRHEGLPSRVARTPWELARRLSPQTRAARAFLAATAVRIIYVPLLLVLTSPWARSLLLAIFIVWDIYDGKVARRFGADYPFRRMLDAYVDRVCIFVTTMTLAIHSASWLPLAISLAARDGALFLGLLIIFRSTGACLLGGAPNRQVAWSWAAWAFSTFWMGPTRTTGALAATWIVLKFAVMVNMFLSSRRVRCDPQRIFVVDSWRLHRE